MRSVEARMVPRHGGPAARLPLRASRWPLEVRLRPQRDSTEQVVPMHREASRIEAELYVRRKADSYAPRKSGQ